MKIIVFTLSLFWLGSVVRSYANEIQTVGDVLQIALPLTALAATYSMDDPEGRKQFFGSFGSSFVAIQMLKSAVGKEQSDGSNSLNFPSGYTSSAFSSAAFLQKRYGWDIGVPAYIAASFVGYSRVHAQKHDWADVGAGALLALGMNQLFVSDTFNFNIGIAPVDKGIHVSIAMSF